MTDPLGHTIAAKNLLSGAGLRWFLEYMVTNFAHFAPLGLVLVGAIVVRRFTIPRAARLSGMEKVAEVTQKSADLSPGEKKGLRHAGIAFLIFALAVIALTVPPGGPLRNPETSSLVVESPFLRGLIPILFVMFAVPGYFYGRAVGTISMLIPYATFLFVMWTILLFVWFALNLPIGIGEYIYMK